MGKEGDLGTFNRDVAYVEICLLQTTKFLKHGLEGTSLVRVQRRVVAQLRHAIQK